jgi:hypothetical protein
VAGSLRPTTSAHRFGSVACRRFNDVRTMLTIFGCGKGTPSAVAYAIGLYITSAYWFTASTSFANPAVTVCPFAFQIPLPALRLTELSHLSGRNSPVCLRRHCSGVGFGTSNRPNDQIRSGCPVRRSRRNFRRPLQQLEAIRALFAEASRCGISSDRVMCAGGIRC